MIIIIAIVIFVILSCISYYFHTKEVMELDNVILELWRYISEQQTKINNLNKELSNIKHK